LGRTSGSWELSASPPQAVWGRQAGRRPKGGVSRKGGRKFKRPRAPGGRRCAAETRSMKKSLAIDRIGPFGLGATRKGPAGGALRVVGAGAKAHIPRGWAAGVSPWVKHDGRRPGGKVSIQAGKNGPRQHRDPLGRISAEKVDTSLGRPAAVAGTPSTYSRRPRGPRRKKNSPRPAPPRKFGILGGRGR